MFSYFDVTNFCYKVYDIYLNLQIENEYGPVEWEIGAPGKAYTSWAAQMAVGLDTGVPWDMCKQEDAPDPVVRFSSITRVICIHAFGKSIVV